MPWVGFDRAFELFRARLRPQPFQTAQAACTQQQIWTIGGADLLRQGLRQQGSLIVSPLQQPHAVQGHRSHQCLCGQQWGRDTRQPFGGRLDEIRAVSVFER